MERVIAVRRFGWRLRVAFKQRLARHRCIIEFCKDCGVEQPLVWTADDALWNQVWGNAGGVLCPSCFTARCQRLDLFIRWIPQVER